ncbi:hypothetical protein KCV03_g2, partial [Aureobasidium melanogenum]
MTLGQVCKSITGDACRLQIKPNHVASEHSDELPPPRSFRIMRARWMNFALPTIIEPMGAPRPLVNHKDTLSKQERRLSAYGTMCSRD